MLMKLHLLLLTFIWSSTAVCIEQAEVRKHGNWPIETPQIYQALIPVINKKMIQAYDPITEQASWFSEQVSDLFYAGIVGSASLAPDFLIGYY